MTSYQFPSPEAAEGFARDVGALTPTTVHHRVVDVQTEHVPNLLSELARRYGGHAYAYPEEDEYAHDPRPVELAPLGVQTTAPSRRRHPTRRIYR